MACMMLTPDRFRLMWKFLHQYFFKLNLYQNYLTDETIVHRQILSTRSLVVSFVICLIVLVLYTAFSVKTVTEIVAQPNFETFRILQNEYPTTLKCPCTQLAHEIGIFFKTTPMFHQVCKSDFVSQAWIDHVFGSNSTFIWPFDIRTSISAMWQLIAILCENSKNIITNELNNFAHDVIITPTALHDKALEAVTQAAFSVAYQRALYDFIRSLTILHRFTQANGYLTGITSNFIIATGGRLLGRIESLYMVDIKNTLPGENKFCLCQRHGSCPISGGIYLSYMGEMAGAYNHNNIIPTLKIPGLVSDCLPFLMVFSSTLECFYNHSCVNTILSVYPRNITISVLNNSIRSRFTIDRPIKYLIDELFVEEIINETNFELYYEHCKPNQCIYTYQQQFQWIYIITMIASLVGGLSTGLYIMTPHLLNIIFIVKRKAFDKTQGGDSKKNQVLTTSQLKYFFRIGFKYMTEFNLFSERYSQDIVYTIRGRFATRLYAFLMTISMITLIIYTAESKQTITKVISLPSIEQYDHLYGKYSDTLQCSCTTLSIPYGRFMDVKPLYHQICSSDFVQPWWYQSLAYYWALVLTYDFRFLSSSYFRTIAMFCEVANLTINAAYYRFSSTQFVNSNVVPRHTFLSKTNGFVDTFKSSTRLDFLYKMSLFKLLLHADQYLSGMETNAIMLSVNATEELLVNHRPFLASTFGIQTVDEMSQVTCSCQIDEACTINWVYETMFQIEGIEKACYMIDIALKSSILCWYNRSCIGQLIEGFVPLEIVVPANVTELNSSLESRFSIGDAFEKIVDQLMVENYTSSASFQSFYNICHPSTCTYTYNEKSNIIYVITTIIALFGGLNIIHRLLSITVAKLFYFYQERKQERIAFAVKTIQNTNVEVQAQIIPCEHLFRLLAKINLFRNRSTDPRSMYQQKITTWVYSLSVLICFISIISYTVAPTDLVTKTIPLPNLSTYESLKAKYGTNLQCPCSQVSIAYKEFLTINAEYHQVCTSAFIDRPWIRGLFANSLWLFYQRSDIRIRGAAYFNLLSLLCQSIQTIIYNGKTDYLETAFRSFEILSEAEFYMQINISTKNFMMQTKHQFSSALMFYRNMTHASSFISTYFLNWYAWIPTGATDATVPTSPVVMDDGCSCGTRNDCVEQAAIFDINSGALWYTVPGMVIGCSVVETLLRSTLECLYSQECINTLKYFHAMNSLTIQALDGSLSSRFGLTTNVETLVEELFVENWQFNVSYAKFYSQCAPIECSYSEAERKNVLFVISRLLGLYGGITATLRFVLPYSIKLIFTIMNYWKRNRVISML